MSAVECYSNFARYDGLRYGLRVREDNAFLMYKKIRSASYGMEVKRKLMTGIYILSSRLGYKRFYNKAVRVRFLIKKRLTSLLKLNVGLVTPTAPKLNLSLSSNNKLQWETDVYTVLSSITGLPSIQVPTGLDKNSLPLEYRLLVMPLMKLVWFAPAVGYKKSAAYCLQYDSWILSAICSLKLVFFFFFFFFFFRYTSNIVVSKV
ncbi:MAG: amidase family protein [Candidatus Hodgkinia cicadicola]